MLQNDILKTPKLRILVILSRIIGNFGET